MRRFAGFLVMAVLMSACTGQFVKRTEFDATVGELRATDAEFASDLAGFRGQFVEMTRDLHGKFEGYDARIGDLQGRLRVEMSAHFEFDDATLRAADKPALSEFSDVVRQYDPNVVVTVEGFTDPQGDQAYNQQLGLNRANAVRDFLINVGGLHPKRVRAVSYGEDKRRLISSGSDNDNAINRRVSLVVDYVGISPRG
mgnify:CR=1 FL=1